MKKSMAAILICILLITACATTTVLDQPTPPGKVPPATETATQQPVPASPERPPATSSHGM